MKRLLAAVFLAVFPLAAHALSPDTALGRWKTQTHDGIVEITPCGASICGQLITSIKLAADPNLRDLHNANPALRGRKLVGMTLLEKFTRTEDAWVRGAIYNPDDGQTYHARVTPIDQDHLRVRGCVIVPLCQTQLWTREK